MTRISTVIGELNLWGDKVVELADADFDDEKRKVTFTFLVTNKEGRQHSIDKLKIYGVTDFDKSRQTFEPIKLDIKAIDLTIKKRVGLLNSTGTLLCLINCDKYEFNQRRL